MCIPPVFSFGMTTERLSALRCGQTLLLTRSAGALVTPSGSEAASHLRPPSVAACLSRGRQMFALAQQSSV